MKSSKGNSNKAKRENEHIPRYIKTQPWYYQASKKEIVNTGSVATVAEAGSEQSPQQQQDYLVHHRQDPNKKKLFDIDNNDEAKIGNGIDDKFISRHYSRYNNSSNGQNTKHGGDKACDNCGMLGHLKRDCLERPRKFARCNSTASSSSISGRKIDGNRQVGSDIRIRNDDELDYDAKKDRWFGYDGSDYDQVLNKWKDKSRKDDHEEASQDAKDKGYDTDEEIELFKLGLMKDSKGLLKQKTQALKEREIGRSSVRLREDKAAYLNDINSSETNYDPKSRLYKSESLGSIDERSKMFRRHLTGEGKEFSELNQFTRDYAKKSGIRDEVSDSKKLDHVLIANPTKYEQLMKQSKDTTVADKNKKPEQEIATLKAKELEGTKQNNKSKKTLESLYR